MMRSLWTSASGMIAQQLHMDTVAHNLSNVNTNGYKKVRLDFNDLIYVTKRSGNRMVQGDAGAVVPTNLQVGHGVTPAATKRLHTNGALQETGIQTDYGLDGIGFFQIEMPDGSIGYTRDGSFVINPEDTSTLYTNLGYRVLDCEWNHDEKVATFSLATFINPAGLESKGDNLLFETVASGAPEVGEAGTEGFGRARQGFLEMSNVQVVEEMVQMIVAQRAYESNTKAIQASDEMLGMANQLRR